MTDNPHNIGRFKVGDVVSRTGSDEQVVFGVNEAGDLISVRCIKPDRYGVFSIGDEECNVPWRYKYVRDEE